MATRSRTQLFLRYRASLRTHKRGPRTSTELKEFKVHKNLLAAQSDDEGSTTNPHVYSVPPVWVTLVDDMNRDVSQIKIKSACRASCASLPPTHESPRPFSARSLGAVYRLGEGAAARLCRRR